MTRTARIVLPGCPHHVIVRGNNRRRLFSYGTDCRRYLGLLAEGLDQTGCALHQVTLMTNHVHHIVTPQDEDDLAHLIKRCCQRYAQLRNRRRDATGKLFEQRFYSKPLLDERALATVTLYNDTNALRAKMVEHAGEHRWSTAGLHLGQPELSAVPRAMWTPSAWYLELGETAAERAAAYSETLAIYLDAPPPREQPAARAEALSAQRYTRRLERPDGTSAAEEVALYVPGPARAI